MSQPGQPPTQYPLPDSPVVLELRDLHTYFVDGQAEGRAAEGVSLSLRRAEVLGLVGESGSGKSVTAMSILGLQPKPKARIVRGEIMFNGKDLAKASDRELRGIRGRRIALVMQNPMTALNPVFTIGEQLAEALRLHQGLKGPRLKQRMVELLTMFRISEPEQRLRAYPHQLSGGMRQRVVGAIAAAGDPEVLIADEPTTALDATVEAAYLELLKEIQRRTGMAVLFITHDLGVVAELCDRVAVMYSGRVVETGSVGGVFAQPAHPYTRALLESVPDVYQHPGRLPSIPGQPPSIFDKPPGCPFAPRCPVAEARCRSDYPPETVVSPGHTASCWRLV